MQYFHMNILGYTDWRYCLSDPNSNFIRQLKEIRVICRKLKLNRKNIEEVIFSWQFTVLSYQSKSNYLFIAWVSPVARWGLFCSLASCQDLYSLIYFIYLYSSLNLPPFLIHTHEKKNLFWKDHYICECFLSHFVTNWYLF